MSSTTDTPNAKGFNWNSQDEISLEFLRLMGRSDHKILDLGAGEGRFSEQLLKSGCFVTANDLSQVSLEALKERVPQDLRSKLRLSSGDFLSTLDIQEASLSGVYSARMMQFLRPVDYERGLEKIYRWLQPKGLLAIIVFSPFRKFLDPLQKELKEKKLSGTQWPYEIKNYQDYLSPQLRSQLPNYVNLFDEELLKQSLQKAGFDIIKWQWIAFEPSGTAASPKGLVGALAYKK